MLKPLPEEQVLPDHNFQLADEEARLMQTRLRRKMIVNPKPRTAPLAVMQKPSKLPTTLRVSSPMNLAVAVLSSATFGWLVHSWHGR
jgi:hypothetical protein